MALRPAIDIANQSLQELGLPTAQTIMSELGDATGFQIMGLMNGLGAQLVKANDWQFLEKTAEFTGDGVKNVFTMPSDFGRVVNQTMWASKNKRPVFGPLTAQAWSWVQYGIVSVGVYYRYRIIANELHVFPTPAAGEQFHFYYISKNWVFNDSDPDNIVWRDKIEQDSDVPVFDDTLMVAGSKFKIWAAKGMDSRALWEEFNYLLNADKAQTEGAPVINLSRTGGYLYLSGLNIADGDWNV